MLLIGILGLLLAGAVANFTIGGDRSRWLSAASLVASLGLSVYALIATLQGTSLGWHFDWLPMLGVRFSLAADGPALALTLVGLIGGLAAIAVSASETHANEGFYHGHLLLALLGAQGCFLANDGLTFFAFFELMLVPGWYIVRAGGDALATLAATRFFLFTQAGGLLLLLGLVVSALGVGTEPSFAWDALAAHPPAAWAALLIVIGLGVKLPLFPLHTWLADAYTRAPTSATIVFAAVLSKAGAFGLWRTQPLFDQAGAAINLLAIGGVVGVLGGALLAWSSTDFKRLVAYSSLSHLGYVALGLAAGTPLAMQGALLLMVAHGLTVAGLFAIVATLQKRAGTSDLSRLGGLWHDTPALAFAVYVFALGSIGMPGFVGFAGELTTLLAVFPIWPVLAALAQLGVLGATLYATSAIHRAFTGPSGSVSHASDLNGTERLGLGLLAVLIIALGVWPDPLLHLFSVL